MPPCIEKKFLLSGGVQVFSCELLHYSNDFGVLRYVIDRHYDISGLALRPGDITTAFYWTDRPYTLYVWRSPEGKLLAHYFNIADRVHLAPHEFVWRDLVVDILISPPGGRTGDDTIQILDEHELPRDLDVELARYIESAKSLITRTCREIITEAEQSVPPF